MWAAGSRAASGYQTSCSHRSSGVSTAGRHPGNGAYFADSHGVARLSRFSSHRGPAQRSPLLVSDRGGLAETRRPSLLRVQSPGSTAAESSIIDVSSPLDNDDTEEDEDEWELVEIGRIGIPHGVRGEVKVQPLTDFPELRLGEPGIRYLVAPTGGIQRRRDGAAAAQPRQIKLERGRPVVYKGHKMWLVKLQGVDTPEQAETLRNSALCIRDLDRDPDLELEGDEEFYVQELVGMEVVLQSTGQLVGEVVAVYDGTGTHDVLRIRLDENFAVAEAAPEPQQPNADSGASSGGASGSSSSGSSRGGGAGKGGKASVRTALLPFVRALVPVVDLEEGRLEVCPPEGLLEATVSTPRRGAAPAKRRAAGNQRRAREVARAREAEKEKHKELQKQPERGRPQPAAG